MIFDIGWLLLKVFLIIYWCVKFNLIVIVCGWVILLVKIIIGLIVFIIVWFNKVKVVNNCYFLNIGFIIK